MLDNNIPLSDIANSLLINRELFKSIPDLYFKYVQYVPLFILSFVVTALLTPWVGFIAKALDITTWPQKRRIKLNKDDDPKRHIKKKIVPLLGGLAVLIPLMIYIPLMFPLDSRIIFILVAIGILTLSGIFDDIYVSPPTLQMGVHILAATLIAVSTINLEFVNNPFGDILRLDNIVFTHPSFSNIIQFVFPGDLIMIGWIIITINAVKWVSGVDALIEVNMIIVYLMLFIIGIRTDSIFVVTVAMLMMGGVSGFLIYNFPPAKILTASTGKTVFGFLIAVLAVINGAKVTTTIFILLLPFMDFLFVIMKRYYLHRPRNLLQLMRYNDTNHFHHQLYKMNLSQRQILVVEASITLFAGSIAVLTAGTIKLFGVLFGMAMLLVFIFLLHRHAQSLPSQPEAKAVKKETPESKYRY